MQPEQAYLAVVDEIGASFFDAREGGADAGGDLEVAGGGGETVFGGEAVDGDDARVEEEGEFGGGHGFEHAHRVGAAIGGLGAGCQGVRWGEGAKGGGCLPLRALHLRRPSMYMLNSFRFSGRTSCPGGCDTEKLFR